MKCGPGNWCGNVKAGEPFDRARHCERCWLMTHSAPHRKNWGVDGPAVEVRPPLLTGRLPLPVRRKTCQHLGAKAKPGCGCTDRYCDAGRGVVRHLVECQSCDGYESRTGSPPL